MNSLTACPQNSLRVLLLGATGFIGSHIHDALSTICTVEIIGPTRRPSNLIHSGSNPKHRVDITDLDSLVNAVVGVDVVVNAVSYVGSSAEKADLVNRVGTLNLIRACEGAGIARFIQLGTTAVYGSGPHRGGSPSEMRYHPESSASVTRMLADQAVLNAGGTVVRPSLVYGAGDRWFIPTLFRVFRGLGGMIEGPGPELSMIDAHSLGELVAGVITTAENHPGVFHAADPSPVPLSTLLTAISSQIAHLPLSRNIAFTDALSSLRCAGLSAHQIKLITEDHWYDAGDIWEYTSASPRGLRIGHSNAIAWYRDQLEEI